MRLLLFLLWALPALADTSCINPAVSPGLYTSLVGWYRYDEPIGATTPVNSWNASMPAVLFNGATLGRAGLFNRSLALVPYPTAGGSTGIPANVIPSSFAAGDFTFSVWFIRTTANSAGWLFSMNALDYGSTGFALLTYPAMIYLNVGTWGTFIASASFPSTSAQDTVWQHAALVRRGTTYDVYLNGTLRATASSSAVLSISPNGIRVGTGPSAAENTAVVALDEFMFWQRALTSGEVNRLFTVKASSRFYVDSNRACVCQSQYTGTNCTQCVAGRYGSECSLVCPSSGYYQPTSTSCLACSAGSYTVGSFPLSCEECGAGRYSTVSGSASVSNCIQCGAGSYQSVGVASACAQCLAGTFSESPGGSFCPGSCVPGRYGSVTGSSSQDDCLECPNGKYQDQSGQSSCIACLAGTRYFSTTTPCSVCAPNTYSATNGSTTCEMCPTGTDAKTEGSTACALCAPGTYYPYEYGSCTLCGIGTYSHNNGSSECIPCESGTISGDFGASACVACAAGRYSNGADNCVDCSAGYFSGHAGSSECTRCAAGSWTPDSASTHCALCEPGTASPFESTPCTVCDQGKYTARNGTVDCTQCSPGYIAFDMGSTACTACGAGKVGYPGDQVNCYACGGGMYSAVDGQSQCDSCSPGRFSVAEFSTGCDLCTPGKFQSQPGQDACQDCNAAEYTNTTGATVCIACGPDLVTLNEDYPFTRCVHCDPGFEPSHLHDACNACDPGRASPTGVSCDVCSVGRYSNALQQSECAICQAGTFVGYEGSQQECTACEVGRYSTQEATTCEACSAGRFADVYGLGSCVDCQEGYVSAEAADHCDPCGVGSAPNRTQSACSQCPAGTSSSSGVVCTPCPQGSFTGEAGLAECVSCPLGRSADAEGHSMCTACSIGRFQDSEGSTVCMLCQPGRYTNETGRPFCSMCSAGKAASGDGATRCNSCAKGRFSDSEGFTTCIGCNKGTFANKTAATTCLLCEMGKFAAGNSSYNCSTCPDGFTNYIPGAVLCTPIPMQAVNMSYESQRNPNITTPPLDKPRGSLVMQLDLDFNAIIDMDMFKGQLAMEMARAGNTSESLIFIKSVRAGSIIVEVLMPLTSAQLLQQFLLPDTINILDSYTFPLLRRSEQVVLQVLPAQIVPTVYESYYDLECRGRNSSYPICFADGMFWGGCTAGICSCFNTPGALVADTSFSDRCVVPEIPTGMSCYSGMVKPAGSRGPDYCEWDSSTTEEYDYRDACRYPYYNAFVTRRYCQHPDYPIGSGPNRYRAFFGAPPSMAVDYTRAANGTYVTAGITASTPARPSSIPFLIYTVSLLKPLTPEFVYANPNSLESVRYEGLAYVSNLYDGRQPVESKRLAYIVSNYMYDVSTLQLVSMTFMPGTEGAADYYFSDNGWHYKQCPEGEYAVNANKCMCQNFHVRSIATGRCMPGCWGGYTGDQCSQVITERNCRYGWDKYTLFIAPDCSTIECLPGYEVVGAFCALAPTSYDLELRNTQSVVEQVTQLPIVKIVLLVGALVGSIAIIVGSITKCSGICSKGRK